MANNGKSTKDGDKPKKPGRPNGGVGSSGYIYTSKVNSTLYGALCPACTIC